MRSRLAARPALARPVGAAGRPRRGRRRRRRRHRGGQRPPHRLLRAGRAVPRRLAGRAPRRHHRPRAEHGAARAHPRGRVRRVRRGPHAGGHRGAGRLRPDLPRDGGPHRRGAADLDRVRRLGRRRRVLAGAHRPHRDDPGRGDVPHRPGRRARGPRRGDRRGGPRRPSGPRPQRRLPPGRARRGRGGPARPRAALLPALGGGPDPAAWHPHCAGAAGPRRVRPQRAPQPATTSATRWARSWTGSRCWSCDRGGPATR